MAPPLVLIPGLLCTDELWRPQVDGLAGRVEPHVADVTTGDTVDALAEHILAGAPERFALAGLSMGGYVALAVARSAPDRLLGLALLDTSARPDPPEARLAREELIGLAEIGRFDEVPDRLIPRLVHPDRHDDPELRAVVHRMARAVGPEAFVRQQRSIMARPDARPVLAGVRSPALVLCGRDDVITPLEHHEEMARLLPDATVEVLAHCGHLSTLERPDAVTDALDGWLTRIEAGR